MTLFPVYCDNGWIVVQRRINGSENFHRNWRAYKEGFGNVRGEFFIGLEKLHHLTTMRTHELRIILEDFWGNVRHAQYSEFLIGDENESYELKQLGEYSGNADDALRSHKHAKFSTPDHTDQLRHCAQIYKAGWWFNDDCYQW
ncbi:fibrinogen-like protein 1 [Drosophila busckii]|nr:fibrinogen-like protein 1 [Drosophila busckii]